MHYVFISQEGHPAWEMHRLIDGTGLHGLYRGRESIALFETAVAREEQAKAAETPGKKRQRTEALVEGCAQPHNVPRVSLPLAGLL
mmetsp:Transcript_4700/g.14205  ORF Transcript_4700/g.14205 Transcript_4700/m.14205 type:complete len:86 (+) Transcript_4700:1300-1557(+)